MIFCHCRQLMTRSILRACQCQRWADIMKWGLRQIICEQPSQDVAFMPKHRRFSLPLPRQLFQVRYNEIDGWWQYRDLLRLFRTAIHRQRESTILPTSIRIIRRGPSCYFQTKSAPQPLISLKNYEIYYGYIAAGMRKKMKSSYFYVNTGIKETRICWLVVYKEFGVY